MSKVNWIWKETAEILGVIGIVGSMAFVSFEIRQNTQVSQATSIQAMVDASIVVTLAWAADERTAALVTKVFEGGVPDDFTAIENTTLQILHIAALRATESRYRQIELGLLTGASQDWIGGTISGLYRTPYFEASWPGIRAHLARDFGLYMEEQLNIPYSD